MQLIKLIECKIYDENRVYEIYEGDFVEVYSWSANPYWHTREQYEASEQLMKFAPSRTATIRVLSDGGLIGHWENLDYFREFLRLYLRAEVVNELGAEEV